MSRKLLVKVKDCATVDAHGYATSVISLAIRENGWLDAIVHIQAWASALPSDFDRAMREA